MTSPECSMAAEAGHAFPQRRDWMGHPHSGILSPSPFMDQNALRAWTARKPSRNGPGVILELARAGCFGYSVMGRECGPTSEGWRRDVPDADPTALWFFLSLKPTPGSHFLPLPTALHLLKWARVGHESIAFRARKASFPEMGED